MSSFSRSTPTRMPFLTALLVVAGFSTSAPAGLNQWTTASQPNAVVNLIATAGAGAYYAGSEDGIYLSLDAGTSWANLGGPLLGLNVLSLAVDPQDSTRVYAGVSSGLYTSVDRGASWTQVPDVGTGILSLAAGGSSGDLVLAGSFGRGIFTSSDRGLTWTASDGLADAIVFALAASPWDAQTAYAGTARGLFATRDSGVTWEPLGSELVDLQVRSIRPSSEANVLFAATFGSGVFRSTDAGQTWTAISTGLDDLSVRSLAVDPRSDAVLYAATSTGGIFRTRNSGDLWAAINQGLSNLSTRFVVVDPFDADRVLATGMGAGVFDIRFIPQPQIAVDRATIDFGQGAVGQELVRTLQIVNKGGADLIVTSLEAVRLSPFSLDINTPLVIAAENQRDVDIRFVPGAAGSARDSLLIHSSDPDEPVIAIPLKGLGVQARLKATPATLDFGTVRIGGFVDTSLLLTNAGNTAMTLENAIFDNFAFRVLSFAAQVLQPGQTTAVHLRFVPLQPIGVNAQLEIHTDIANQRIVEIEANGLGTAPDLTVSIGSLDFGTVDLGEPRVLPIEVSNSGNTDLLISGLEITEAAFRVSPHATTESPIRLAPGEQTELEVTFLPLVSGSQTSTLTIVSDAPGVLRSLAIPLAGSGGAVSLITGDPVAAGEGPVDMVTVDADGDGDIDVAAIDSVSGFLHLFHNDGTGLFPEVRVYPESASDFPEWDEPVALATGEIFSSAPDLILADRQAQLISILRNDGSGGFGVERRDIFIGRAISDVLASDLDADGDIDIVVANSDIQSVTLLLNNDEGSFNARRDLDVQFGPSAMISANLNADGHNDLVVANGLSGTLSILRNDRSGGFLQRQDLAIGQQPVALAVVDYDADGDNDILSANAGSRDITTVDNLGAGLFDPVVDRIPVGMRPRDLALSDLTADIFSDLLVAGGERPYVALLENDGGAGFVAQDLIAADTPARRVAISDADGDGDNDILVLSSVRSTLQAFFNQDTRKLDAPRSPSQVGAHDVARDLGRNVEITWSAPELDEQIGRTTEYSIFRSSFITGPFVEIGRASAGARSFIDRAATLADTFHYFMRSGNALLESADSDTVSAVSKPAPFFELELVNEPRLSVGDTLRVRAYVTPADHDIAGISLYLTYDDSALTLLDADVASAPIVPFRTDGSLETATAVQNRLHPSATNQIDVSLTGLGIAAGVRPIELGEIWFRTIKDRSTSLTVDDEIATNRRSAVVEDVTGDWILPFIPARPTQVAIRDFQVRGRVALEGRGAQNLDLQVTLTFVDSASTVLDSPLNPASSTRSIKAAHSVSSRYRRRNTSSPSRRRAICRGFPTPSSSETRCAPTWPSAGSALIRRSRRRWGRGTPTTTTASTWRTTGPSCDTSTPQRRIRTSGRKPSSPTSTATRSSTRPIFF